MTAYLLGFCLEILGRQGAALHYYTLGIQADPVNGELLLARGILRYGRDPQAIFDLEAAVRLGSDIVLPYVFLAHHYLLTNQYERCCDTCEKGAQKQGSRSAKSHLEQWRAVAQAELGFAPDKVRAVFEAAIQLDPSNELAKRNLELFEANLDAKDPHQRKEWEQRSSAGLSQLGLAERLTVLAA